jgi:hypothetical protein
MTWAPRGTGNSGAWAYRGRAILADIVRPITADEAARFGHDHGECVYCARHLSDDRSVAVGYGATCAKNYGLPWGDARQVPRVAPVAPVATDHYCPPCDLFNHHWAGCERA